MNPLTFLPVPKPSAEGVTYGIIALGIMLVLCIIVGIMGKKKWASFDEYLVGKRDIGPWITGSALSASYISGWAFCGSTGIVYTLGFSGMWFAGIFSLVGIIPCIWLAAIKTREFSAKLGAATLPETIGRRFESKGSADDCGAFDALLSVHVFCWPVEGRWQRLVRADRARPALVSAPFRHRCMALHGARRLCGEPVRNGHPGVYLCLCRDPDRDNGHRLYGRVLEYHDQPCSAEPQIDEPHHGLICRKWASRS